MLLVIGQYIQHAHCAASSRTAGSCTRTSIVINSVHSGKNYNATAADTTVAVMKLLLTCMCWNTTTLTLLIASW
jgi:hypothetical protein